MQINQKIQFNKNDIEKILNDFIKHKLGLTVTSFNFNLRTESDCRETWQIFDSIVANIKVDIPDSYEQGLESWRMHDQSWYKIIKYLLFRDRIFADSISFFGPEIAINIKNHK